MFGVGKVGDKNTLENEVEKVKVKIKKPVAAKFGLSYPLNSEPMVATLLADDLIKTGYAEKV